MASKGTVTNIGHKDLLKIAADKTGIASKSIEEGVKAYQGAIQDTVRTQRPKNFDDALKLSTPFGAYIVRKVKESAVAGGGKSPERYVTEYSFPKAILEAANEGLAVTAKPAAVPAKPAAKKAG